MNAKMFLAGFVSALVLLALLIAGATQLHRSAAAVIIASALPSAKVVPTPFADISGLTPLQQSSIGKLYGAHITTGTTPTTFSPSAKTSLYQWFLFIGRAMQTG